MNKINLFDLITYYRNPTLEAQFTLDTIMKSAGSVTSATAGVWNKVFGAILWNQIPLAAPTLGVLPTVEWERSGIRVISDFMADITAGIPSAEGAIPPSVKPDIITMSVDPKEYVLTQDITDVVMALSNTADDVGINYVNIRMAFGKHYLTNLERMIHDVSVGTEGTTPAGWWHRMCDIVHNSGTIYGINRATNPWANALVDTASSLRVPDIDFINKMKARIENQGVKPNVIITSPLNTAYFRSQADNKMFLSILDNKPVKISVNGLETSDGYGVGVLVNQLYGLPIIESPFVGATGGSPAAGETRLPNIYVLTTEFAGDVIFGKMLLIPTTYYEANLPLAQNLFGTRIAYRTVGNLVCRRFNVQGKINALKQ
jgi:hypothetical protein